MGHLNPSTPRGARKHIAGRIVFGRNRDHMTLVVFTWSFLTSFQKSHTASFVDYALTFVNIVRHCLSSYTWPFEYMLDPCRPNEYIVGALMWQPEDQVAVQRPCSGWISRKRGVMYSILVSCDCCWNLTPGARRPSLASNLSMFISSVLQTSLS